MEIINCHDILAKVNGTVMDFVMRKTTDGHDFGIVWGQKKLADLDFADDLALLCHTQQALQDMTDYTYVGKKSVYVLAERRRKL